MIMIFSDVTFLSRALDTVIKDGFLYKKGHMFNTEWQRRHFVLTSAGLSYYDDASQNVVKGNNLVLLIYFTLTRHMIHVKLN